MSVFYFSREAIMNIIKMKVEDLIPYVNNPRNNENAVDMCRYQ